MPKRSSEPDAGDSRPDAFAVLPEQRRTAILDLAVNENLLTVEQFAERLGVSKETIRRDLHLLDRAGQLRRVHGGALILQTGLEAPIAERRTQNVELKLKIAAAAARQFSAHDTLMIDAGTTTAAFAAELAGLHHLTVVTNSLDVASRVSTGGRDNVVYLLGGMFRSDPSQVIGSLALEQIERFTADHAVLTVGAIDVDAGLVSDFDMEEAMMARAMIRRSTSLTVLADHTKFGKQALVTVCELGRVDRLVSDNLLDRAIVRKLHHRKIDLIIA